MRYNGSKQVTAQSPIQTIPETIQWTENFSLDFLMFGMYVAV